MLTRRATSRELEDKLKATLKELESSKTLCNQILQEREDSEIEIQDIVDKNTALKRELSHLHTQHNELLKQHEQFQQIITESQQCSETYEVALRRITVLECELKEANNTILLQDSQILNEQETTNRLKSTPASVSLNKMESSAPSVCPLLNSHKKVKKYIKLNRSIKKFKKLMKRQNVYKCNISLRQQHSDLITQLKDYSLKYKVDIQYLQEQLLQKENLVKKIFDQYEISQQQVSEHIQKACGLLDRVKFNAERYETLASNLSCKCSSPASQKLVASSMPAVPQTIINLKKLPNRTVIYSDSLGAGFGPVLNNLNYKNVINNVYKNANFNYIVKKILESHSFESGPLGTDSSIVIAVGNSLDIKKKDIIKGVNSLLKLKFKKIMICAFPYSKSLSESDNNYIYSLNNLLQKMAFHNSDHLLFMDSNKFVQNYFITQDSMYLPKFYRHLLASLIGFNIDSCSINSVNQISVSNNQVLSTCTNNAVINCLNY